MKKNELKRMLKPLIKECIKEVIFEEGALSTIITEVAKGLTNNQPLVEQTKPQVQYKQPSVSAKKSLNEKKKKLLDAIGKSAYNGVNLFENTTPTKAAPTERQAAGALSDVDPNDPGVDISSIFTGQSSQIWKKLAGGK